MAPAIDSIGGLFSAIDVTPPAPSSTTDAASGGFADHLQQASRSQSSPPKPSAPPTKNSDNSSNSSNTPHNANAAQSDSPSTERTNSSKSTERAPSASQTDEQAQVDKPVDAELVDDESDESAATDVIVAVLAAAQVVVPEVIVAPQVEIAVHTEVAAANESKSETPVVESTATATQAAAVDTLPTTAESAAKTTDATAEKVKLTDPLPPVEIVDPRERKANDEQQPASSPQPNGEQITTDATVELTAAQVELVKQQANETQSAEPRRATNDTSDANETVLNNEVTQVAAPTANGVTSTTVVAALTPGNSTTSGDAEHRRNKHSDAIESIGSQDRSTNNTPPTQADAAGSRPPRFGLEKLTPGTTNNGETHTLTEVERVRFVQRVAKAVHTAVENGGPIRLRLSPPELGAVRIEMRVVEGQMSVRMETETSQARTALLDNLPLLRERLEQQDIKIAKFDVDLFGGSGSLPQNPQRDLPQDAPLPRHQLRRDLPHSTSVETTTTAPRPTIAADGRLNVVI